MAGRLWWGRRKSCWMQGVKERGMVQHPQSKQIKADQKGESTQELGGGGGRWEGLGAMKMKDPRK